MCVAFQTCADKNVRIYLHKNATCSALRIDRTESTKFGRIHKFDKLLKNSRVLGVCREIFQPDLVKIISSFAFHSAKAPKT
jgi:hypothetical protein